MANSINKSEQDPPPLCKRRCLNGGTCIRGQNRCKCLKGFKGRFCNKCKLPLKEMENIGTNYTLSVKCSGGCGRHGKCVGPETCNCKKGYTGKNCKIREYYFPFFLIFLFNFYIIFYFLTAICSPNCQNGGLCIRPNRCKCLSAFSGKLCQH